MSSTIFLSTVTSEFGALRARLARLFEQTKRVHVRHQDDFVHRGVLTLQKLEEEVEASEIVFHAIGARPGSPAPADQSQELLARRMDIRSALPDAITRQAREGKLTYTQWEAWLAIALGKRLCCYRLSDRELEPGQLLHAQHLASCKRYPDSVANDEALYDAIISSLIALDIVTQQELRRPIKLPYPTLGALFKGRDSFLQQLRESLTKATAGRAAIVGKAIHGLGGVGKTRLAVEYAWQNENAYTALLFITADTPEALNRNLADLVGPEMLDLPEQDVQEQEKKKIAAVLRWLQKHPGWLLIVDNVDTEEVATQVEELLAKLHGGQVLITSRLQKWGNEVETLELDVLDQTDAANLLLERTSKAQNPRRSRIEREDDAETARVLAGDLDGLALALEQAGAYICQCRIGLADYLALWRSHLPEVQAAFDPRIMKYPRSVAATWRTTLDQLSPPEVALLNLLAWFAPEPIPASVLNQITEETLAPLLATKVEGGRTGWLPRLADYSLIRWNHEAGEVSVHRVVQEILRTQQKEPNSFLGAALLTLNRARPTEQPDDVRTWPTWDQLQPHIAFAVEEGASRGVDRPTILLISCLGLVNYYRANYPVSEYYHRRVLKFLEERLGPNDLEVAECLNNLGALLIATYRLDEAESMHRRALAIQEQVYGDNHVDVATSLNNLAAVLKRMNRLAQAEPLYRRTLAIHERLFGPNHPDVATCLNNLAEVFKNTDRLGEAESLLRRALTIDEQACGPNHHRAARSADNLAVVLKLSNRVKEAEPLYRRALAIRERTFGKVHPSVATSLHNLASLLKDTKRRPEAEPLYRRSLAIRKQVYGPRHPEVAVSLETLAKLLQSMRRSDEAQPFLRECQEIRQALGPPATVLDPIATQAPTPIADRESRAPGEPRDPPLIKGFTQRLFRWLFKRTSANDENP